MSNDAIIRDLSNKVMDDVGDAMRRNMLLSPTQQGRLAIVSSGALAAIANAFGVYTAVTGEAMDVEAAETFIAEFIRPMVMKSI